MEKAKTKGEEGIRCRCYERQRPEAWRDWSLTVSRSGQTILVLLTTMLLSLSWDVHYQSKRLVNKPDPMESLLRHIVLWEGNRIVNRHVITPCHDETFESDLPFLMQLPLGQWATCCCFHLGPFLGRDFAVLFVFTHHLRWRVHQRWIRQKVTYIFRRHPTGIAQYLLELSVLLCVFVGGMSHASLLQLVTFFGVSFDFYNCAQVCPATDLHHRPAHVLYNDPLSDHPILLYHPLLLIVLVLWHNWIQLLFRES